jgi:hypothetical protein
MAFIFIQNIGSNIWSYKILDLTSDSLEATYKKYWVKLEGDMDVQSMFSSVEFEKEPHRLYATFKKTC